jgi:shikimate dehydrogenase
MSPSHSSARSNALAGRRPRGSFLIGLVGEAIGESRTPAMHEEEARRLGIPLVYRLLDTDRMGAAPPDISELLRFARLLGFSGLNVTYPYKQAVLPLLDELSVEARGIAAVNTITIRGGRMTGHNTDYWGFRESLQSEMRGELRDSVLLLGAGGAGAAIAQALLDIGVGRLTVCDPDEERAGRLTESLQRRYGAGRVALSTDTEQSAAEAKGVVNATPVGMAKLPGTPIPADWLRSEQWVADVIYFPAETAFLRAARDRGCRTLNGGGMAVFQAARAFELFTGVDPDPAAMRRTFRRFDGAGV